jgi:hypothetical protein
MQCSNEAFQAVECRRWFKALGARMRGPEGEESTQKPGEKSENAQFPLAIPTVAGVMIVEPRVSG